MSATYTFTDEVLLTGGVKTWRVYDAEWTAPSGETLTARFYRAPSRGDIRQARAELRGLLAKAVHPSLKVTYLGRHSYTEQELAA